MLVVDLHALKTVYILDFLEQVFSQFLFTQNFQDIGGIQGTIHERSPRRNLVTISHRDIGTPGNGMFIRFHILIIGADKDLARALEHLAEFNCAVDLCHLGRKFGFPGLEQLRNPGESTGDILGLGKFRRNLGQGHSGCHNIPVLDQQVGVDRKVEPALDAMGFFITDHDLGLKFIPQPLIFYIYDNRRNFPGGLITVMDKGDIFFQVLQLGNTILRSQDGIREGVPLHQQVVLVDLLIIRNHYLGSIDHRVHGTFPSLCIHDLQGSDPVHGNHILVLVFHHGEIMIADLPFVAGMKLCLSFGSGSHTTNVECPHGQLSSGFSNGLRGDDPHRFSQFDDPPGGQVPAIACLANAGFGFTGQRGTNLHAKNTRFNDLARFLFINLFICGHNDPLGIIGIHHINKRVASQDSFQQGFNHFTILNDSGYFQAADGTAVFFLDNHFDRGVHQLPGQVSGFRGFQRRVRQALTCAMGGYEVLQNRKTFLEVGRDGGFNNLSGGFGHETTHSGQLLQLVLTAPGTRVRHHEDWIDAVPFITHAFHVGEHGLTDIIRRLAPFIDDIVVTFTRGHQTV